MTIENDFETFAAGVGANVLTQAQWVALTSILANGFTSGVLPSTYLNKAIRQASIIANVVAQLINQQTGQNTIDDGTTATLLANLTAAISGSDIPGSFRNAKMSVATASASATFTADEVAVAKALGGASWRLPNYSQTINLATTGAGGMDTGSAPVSGFVALYAIFNPATATASILATNATAAAAPTIYGGANIPSGYIASGLIGVWPTNGSGQFPVCYQIDRENWYYQTIYSGAGFATFTSQSIAAGVPKNATKWKANWACGSTALGPVSLAICPTAGGQGTPGYTCGQLSASAASQNIGSTLEDMIILTPQTIYFANSGTASSFTLNSYGYWFR